MSRTVVAAVLGLLPLPAVAWAAVQLADAAGCSLGRVISGLAGGAAAGRGTSVAASAPSGVLRAASQTSGEGARTARSAPPRSRAAAPGFGKSAQRQPPARWGIRIRAQTVLRIANSGQRPTGSPIQASGQRPAGLVLHGVGALGVGLQDGDILTSAAGRPALTPGDVIGVVLASRGARVAVISGRFWRNGQPWQIVVEQPYLQHEPPGASRKRGPRSTAQATRRGQRRGGRG